MVILSFRTTAGHMVGISTDIEGNRAGVSMGIHSLSVVVAPGRLRAWLLGLGCGAGMALGLRLVALLYAWANHKEGEVGKPAWLGHELRGEGAGPSGEGRVGLVGFAQGRKGRRIGGHLLGREGGKEKEL